MPELRMLNPSMIASPRLPEGSRSVKFGDSRGPDRPIYAAFRAPHATRFTHDQPSATTSRSWARSPEARRREQRLADAISHGAPRDAAPEALLSTLRAEETRRKSLEEQLAMLPQPTAVVSVDRDRVTRELRTRAGDMRGVLLRQGAPARDALQALLLDRVDCTPVLVAGTRGYAFTATARSEGLVGASRHWALIRVRRRTSELPSTRRLRTRGRSNPTGSLRPFGG
jgi:hypothetical protein